MACHDVAVVAEVQQSPVVTVAAKDYMASPSSVASVGAAIRDVFFAPHVGGASTALTGAAVYLYEVDKIRFSHILLLFRIMRAKIVILRHKRKLYGFFYPYPVFAVVKVFGGRIRVEGCWR